MSPQPCPDIGARASQATDNYDGPPLARIAGRSIGLQELGLGKMAHEDGVNCTAQHVPEGSLLIYSPTVRSASVTRETIPTTDIAPSILGFFGLQAPGYMRGVTTLLEQPRTLTVAA